MKAMSAHPDDKDVSFEELMEQYRQYEVSLCLIRVHRRFSSWQHMLGVRCKFVECGAGKSPGSPIW